MRQKDYVCFFEIVVLYELMVFADELLLQEDLVQMVPMVNESNAMAEELKKPVIFIIKIVE